MKKKQNEGLNLTENDAMRKFAQPDPDTTPMFDDFFPVIKSANLPAAALLALAAIYGEKVDGINPRQLSVALVSRNLTKEDAFDEVE